MVNHTVIHIRAHNCQQKLMYEEYVLQEMVSYTAYIDVIADIKSVCVLMLHNYYYCIGDIHCAFYLLRDTAGSSVVHIEVGVLSVPRNLTFPT